MEREQTQNLDFLVNAKLGKLMLKFCIPCILSLLVSALYNIVDQIFVGNSELSVLGNAATGVVFPMFVIAQAFAWWIGDGCAAYLNICQGKGETEKSHKAVGTGLVITVLISVILIAVFFPLKRPVLLTFGASVDTTVNGEFIPGSIDYAIEYFNIILPFFPIYMAMNMMNAVVRADGAPGWSMASMLSGAIVNIGLDPAFIYGCKWGMAGAAWATVIGQCVSFAIAVIYFCRTKTFKLKLKSFIPDFKAALPAIKLGLSSFITQLTVVIISVVCNVMLKKYGAASVYGENIPVALIGIEGKVFTVVINIVVGIVLGCQPIIGYNMGARNYPRIKKLYLYILSSTVIIGLVFTVIFEAAPDAVVAMFGNPDPNQVDPERYWEFGRKLFRIFLMFLTFTCTTSMSSIFFQALGKPVFATIASLVRNIICFVPLVCTLPLAMGIDGCIIAAPVSDVIAIVVTVILTVLCFKNLDKTADGKMSEKAIGADICADESAFKGENGVAVSSDVSAEGGEAETQNAAE